MKSLNEIMMLISDSGNVIVAKFVNGLGAVSAGAGVTLGAVATVMPQEQSFWASSVPIIAGVVSIFGGLTFIAKNLFDMWLAYRKRDK